MIHALSILIPTYNNVCHELVKALHAQASLLSDFHYEIIVADDGSTDKAIIEDNRIINTIPNCRYIEREKNVGRAAIRNYLAQKAKYEWLLFMDCDVVIEHNDFIEKYRKSQGMVVVGGLVAANNHRNLSNNIRYIYEKDAERHFTAEERQKREHKEFRTTNFLINRNIAHRFPFNEEVVTYGYEDVLMGKKLYENNIHIEHIDNTVGIDDYEDNPTFIAKTEEALRTLKEFESALRGYSTLIRYADSIKNKKLTPIFHTLYKWCGKSMRNNLTGNKPRLFLFNIYKLMYYLSL